MSNRLDDVRAKTERAREQALALDADVRQFLEAGPYVARAEYNEETGEDLYRAHVIREPPPRISVIVGEIVHDLRSALDHLAWQLTRPERQTNHTGFPIFSSPWGPGAKSEAQFLAHVDGMAEEVVEVIRDLQPNQPGAPVNKDHPLYQLHRMNIEDKHHLLNVIGGAAEQKRMTVGGGGGAGLVSVPWPWSWGMPHIDVFGGVLGGQAIAPDYDRPNRLKVYIPAPDRIVRLIGTSLPPRAFVDGTLLTRVLRAPEADVRVEAEFRFSVAFGESGPGNGAPVIGSLLKLVDATDETVGRLARFLPK
ncbi:MAG: hypothetical protein M3P12_12505 [Gemmatimonadota bacterium]|nr:hypothetical protein [Gemmatimonadota bacterium]